MPALVAAEIGPRCSPPQELRSKSVHVSAFPRPKSRNPASGSGETDMAKPQVLDRSATNRENGSNRAHRLLTEKKGYGSQDFNQENRRDGEVLPLANQEASNFSATECVLNSRIDDEDRHEHDMASAIETMENDGAKPDELPSLRKTDAKTTESSSPLKKSGGERSNIIIESSSMRNANVTRKPATRSQPKLKDFSDQKDNKIVVISSRSKLKDVVKEKEALRAPAFSHKPEKLAKSRDADPAKSVRTASEEKEDAEMKMQDQDKDRNLSSPSRQDHDDAEKEMQDSDNSEMGRNGRSHSAQDPANVARCARNRDAPSAQVSTKENSENHSSLAFTHSPAALKAAESSPSSRGNGRLHSSGFPTNKETSSASSSKPASSSPTSGAMERASSAAKANPSLKPSRFSDWSFRPSPMSPASSCRVLERGTSPEHHLTNPRRASLEGERVRSRVKEIFPSRRKSSIGIGSRRFGDSESIVSSEYTMSTVLARDSANLGPFLLKLAKQAVTSGDNPQKALDYATRATRSFEAAADGKPSLDLAMSLHILAAIYCTLGQFEEAIPVLQHSVTVPDVEGGGEDHALAVFAGNMQLGDTYTFLGRSEDALAAYHCGLEVQKRALGDRDPRVGETCRYLAEAHTQVMQFDKAEGLCQHALDIHKEHSAPASVEEATDRRLMGLICNSKGQFEAALEHLVLASMALISNGKDIDVASVDVCIGDTYVSLGRFDEAIFTYQKALTIFKSSKGENHVSVASVYVSLAEAYLKMGKIRESKTYCDSALRIFNKQAAGHQLDEVASGLTDLAVVYEALNEQEQALSLLNKALAILESAPGQHSAIAGVEAQIGVLCYMCGNYVDARASFQKAIAKLRASAEKNSALFGIILNQLGLCCLQLSEIEAAVMLFEESKVVLEATCGSHHPDTLAVLSNLAGAYDALGRLDDAIHALQYVVEVRQELGRAEPELEDERNRLAELLNEAGHLRARRLNVTSLSMANQVMSTCSQLVSSSVPVNIG